MNTTFDPALAAAQLMATRAGQPRAAGLTPPPPDLAASYAVQDRVIGQSGGRACWKMAMMGGVDRQAGAMPVSIIFEDGATVPDLPADAAIEVETAFVLGRDLPAGSSAEDALAAIGTVRLAFEIIGSRFADRQAITPLEALADSFSSAAIVLGDVIDNWQDVLQRPLAVGLHLGDEALSAPEQAPTLPEQADFLVWLANHAAAHGLPLQAGDVIITGARLGPIALRGATVAQARCAAGQVHSAFTYS